MNRLSYTLTNSHCLFFLVGGVFGLLELCLMLTAFFICPWAWALVVVAYLASVGVCFWLDCYRQDITIDVIVELLDNCDSEEDVDN